MYKQKSTLSYTFLLLYFDVLLKVYKTEVLQPEALNYIISLFLLTETRQRVKKQQQQQKSH